VAFPSGTGDNALRFFIDVDEYDNDILGINPMRLLAIGEEEILRQAPVQKGSDGGMNAGHLKRGKFANDSPRNPGCCDEAVLGVAIQENVNAVPNLCAIWDRISREENFPQFASVEIQSRPGILQDRERIAFSKNGHSWQASGISFARKRQSDPVRLRWSLASPGGVLFAAGMLKSILAVIPARNEEGNVATVVAGLFERGIGRVRVVDNGSTDHTAEVARGTGAEVLSEPRAGYGQACWTGTQDLPDDVHWILFCDADGSDDLDAIPAFLEAAEEKDFVLGNRMATAEGRAVMSPAQRFGNWLAPALLWLIFGKRFRDLGPMRLIRREAYEAVGMRDRGFGWTVEMQARACELGLRTEELPVRYFKRRSGVSKVSGNLRGTMMAGSIILSTLGQFFLARFGVGISILLMVAGACLMTPHGDFSVPGNMPWFLAGFAMAAVGYVVSSASRWRWKSFIVAAVLVRLLAFPMAPGTDIWRYMWEGMVQWHGHNPYLVPPTAGVLDGLDVWWRAKINHPDLTAGYPPFVLLIFAGLAAISTSLWFFKGVLVLADLGVCWLLARRFGPDRAAWYALSPLVVYSFAGGGHFDPLMLLPMVIGWFAWEDRRPLRACAWLGVAIGIKYVAAPLLAFVVWRLIREGKWRAAFLGAGLGILPWALALAWFWLRDGLHKLAPVEMVAFARSAEFLPRLVEWLEPETAQRNAIFLWPFAIVVVALILFRKNFARFGEDVYMALFAISPAVHAWYFTWAIPFSSATGNLGFRVAGITVGAYFLLEHRQALGPSLWRLTWIEWVFMWIPILAAFAYSRWRELVPTKRGRPRPPRVASSRTG